MFYLSGEHSTLPSSEVRAAIEAEKKRYQEVENYDCVSVIETNVAPSTLANRLALTKKICTHLWTCPATEKEILKSVSSTDIVDLLPHGKSFAVRVQRVKRSSPQIHTVLLSSKIAKVLKSEIDFKVNLNSPDFEIFCILTENVCVGGITLESVDAKEFSKRKPQRRQIFHPSTLQPKLARCMVNLARTPRNGTLLDPFSGVGGILIEAGLIGARVVGVDMDERMIRGASENLKSFGITNFELRVGDARRLEGIEADAIATDPPYGRQSSTGGAKLLELYRDAFPSLAGALKPHRYLCISSPEWFRIEDFAAEAGLRLVECHEQRVHRSLTRRICVFKKR